MGFKNYKGSIRMASGMIPEGEGYPLMQSCDIQIDEDGNTLDTALAAIDTKFDTIQKLIPLTATEYEARVAAGTIEKDALYLIVEEDSV